MSETTNKSSSSDKTDSTSKSKDSAKSSSSDDGAKSASSDDGAKAKKSDSGASEASAPKTNGSSDVYYGKFSNVKNPAYRGGWDDIWGSSEKAPTRKKPAKKKTLAPVTLKLELAKMPEDLRTGLAEYAQAELKRKKSRLSYDRRDKAGSVDWRIECRIDR